jgi:hypothetical protein
MQMLATDLLKARGGKPSECTIPIEVVESLANGGDGEDIPSKESRGDNNEGSPSHLPLRPRQRLSVEGEALQRTDASRVEEELQKVKAENEVLRIKLEALSKGDDPSEAIQQVFIARAAKYEREIAMLRAQSSPPAYSQKSISHQDRPNLPNLPPRTPGRSGQDSRRVRERSMSPELSRLRAQIFGSMSQSNNLDQEVEAEEKAVAALTSKYLGKNADDDSDDNNHENDDSQNDDSHHQVAEETTENIAVRLEADLYELTNSIGAKEELIQKLLVSQEKYEVCILLLTIFGFFVCQFLTKIFFLQGDARVLRR